MRPSGVKRTSIESSFPRRLSLFHSTLLDLILERLTHLLDKSVELACLAKLGRKRLEHSWWKLGRVRNNFDTQCELESVSLACGTNTDL